MSKITDIQWCDSTVNPIMGCVGCELFPKPGDVIRAIDEALVTAGVKLDSRKLFKELVEEAYDAIPNPLPSHKRAVNTTNLWHLRKRFVERVGTDHGRQAGKAADDAIRQCVTCYAATLHLNRGANLLKPDHKPHRGYAPVFEAVTPFKGRAAEAAGWQDLLGRANQEASWKARLPRQIFVSDMGDALSAKRDFPFLKDDLLSAIRSDNGSRHIWLWLAEVGLGAGGISLDPEPAPKPDQPGAKRNRLATGVRAAMPLVSGGPFSKSLYLQFYFSSAAKTASIARIP